LINYKSN